MLDSIVSRFLEPILEVLYDHAVLIGDSLYVPVEFLEDFVIGVLGSVSEVLLRLESFITFVVFSLVLIGAAAIAFVKSVCWRRKDRETHSSVPADEDK